MNSDQFYRELGRRVAARRAVLKITQSEVGERIGVSRASVANIEAGRQKLYVHQLYPLARALRLESLGGILPTDVPRVDPNDLLDERHAVSPVQRAQIESLIRSAVASARPKARRK